MVTAFLVWVCHAELVSASPSYYETLLVDHMKQYNEGLEIINRLKFVGGPEDTRNRIIALENKAKAGLK